MNPTRTYLGSFASRLFDLPGSSEDGRDAALDDVYAGFNGGEFWGRATAPKKPTVGLRLTTSPFAAGRVPFSRVT